MKLLTLALVLASAASLEAASKCMWGPSYWCTNRETAKECQQTRYCQDNVWKVLKITTPENACAVCFVITVFLESFADNNSTEMEVKATVDSLCDIVPGALRNECKSQVDKYFYQFWDLLQKEVDHHEICLQLKLCSTTRTLQLMKKPMPKASLSDIHKLATAFLKPYMNSNSTEQEVKEAVEQVCNLLPTSVAGTCSAFIDQYFDEIWDWLKEEVN